MTPEAAEALQRAHASLAKAEAMLASNFPDEAGRLAYGAALNAARAYIFEHTGVVSKTHAGTHTEFSRLTRNDVKFTAEQTRFLGRSYKLKTAADYGDGLPADSASAVEAIAGARNLVAAIEAAVLRLSEGA